MNKAAEVDSYPIPRIDDLLASLAGGKLFSKLDLAHAYQQLLLDDASREKCEFLLPEVVYLGHTITAKGLQPTDEKVKAITAAPTPNNVSQLKSYLGMINLLWKIFRLHFYTSMLFSAKMHIGAGKKLKMLLKMLLSRNQKNYLSTYPL